MSTVLPSPKHYLQELIAMNSGDAKRRWKAAIKTAWGNRCAYCGKPPIDDNSLTIDHVRPRSRGGEDLTANCIPACKLCNHAKGSEQWVAWYRMQPYYSLEAEIRIKHWLRTGEVTPLSSNEDTLWYDMLLNHLAEQAA